MRARVSVILRALGIFLAAVPLGAQAALLCADNVTSLQSALTQAQSNGEDDQIEVVAGTYALDAGGLQFASSEPHSLTLFGGYSAGCAQLSSQKTVLSASGLHQLLRAIQNSTSFAASVHIERMTFIDGKTTTEGGEGLEVLTQAGDVRLESNRFLLNHADNFAAALLVDTGGVITLRNNLFFGNSALQMAAGQLLTNNSIAYVVGNTVVGNTAGTQNGIGGIYVGGVAGTHFWISNNIFWNNNSNAAVDLYLSADGILHYNDVGSTAGLAPNALSQDNQSTDPLFAPCTGFLCLGFELESASPLVDAGADNAPDGIGTVDLAGKPRKIGAHVDIGAFENDVIFANEFE